MTYITPHKSYAHIDRLAAWKRGEKPAPVTVEFDLSLRCSLGCHFCFAAGTMVSTPNGDVPIESIRSGDAVCAFDEAKGEATVANVTRIMSRDYVGRMYRVKIAGCIPTICTPEHPFLTTQGWVNAEDLTSDHIVIGEPEDHKVLPEADERGVALRAVTSSRLIGERDCVVYNIETTTGTYVANGAVVHNCHFAHTHTRGPWAKKDRALPVLYDQPGDLADTSMVLRALQEMADAGVKAIVWSGGGEPTLHPDWPKITLYARALGLKQGMYTLGGHLNPDTAAVLARCVDWVVVSLDCADPETYANEKGVKPTRFYAACDGVRMLADTGECVVGVSFLLHADNWSRMDDMVALGKSLGATYVTLRPTIDTSPDDPATVTGDREWVTSALPMLEMLSEVDGVECDPARFTAYRDWKGRSYHTCHAIKLNATVTPDGRIWVCPQRRGVTDSCVGDLSKESFRQAWDRHIGEWTDFGGCRAMCRLHLVNEAIAPLFEDYPHESFV